MMAAAKKDEKDEETTTKDEAEKTTKQAEKTTQQAEKTAKQAEKDSEKDSKDDEKDSKETAKKDKKDEPDEVVHHDAEGQVIPGHEGSSEIATAIAEWDAQTRRVATAPNVGDGQPGKQNAVAIPGAIPVKVDGRNRRTDDDALEGGWAEIIEGENAGRWGAFERVLEYGKDGYPTQVLLRTRDASNELLSVKYADLRPVDTNGGR